MTVQNLDTVQSVTLIGAGPCGCAFAADLASRGIAVMLYGHPEHRGSIPMVEENDGWIKAEGEVGGTYRVKTTSDIQVALEFSPFIVVTVPSYGQNTILETLSPFDLRNHVLIVNVGNFFFLSARQATNAKAVMETDISPYAVRIENGVVLVKGVKKRLAIWAAPSTSKLDRHNHHQAELVLKRQVDAIFSQDLDWCQSLLQVGLNNINPVVHSPAALMNTGWIEATKGDFFFYAQGMSPSVSRVTEHVDEERLAIARAYGFDLVNITDYMNKNYRHGKEFRDYHDFASGSVIHNKTKSAPKNMNHRYLLEDIGFCMVPWYEFGLKAGLPSPTIKAIIDLASVVSGFDYLSHKRGLKAAGLGDATKEQIAVALGGSLDDAPAIPDPLADAHAKINTLEATAPMQAQVAA